MTYTPYNLKDVYEASNQKKFTIISTFAGGGGSSTGYRLAGGNVLAINEFVEEARNTYSQNYPDTPILPDDIKKLTGKDFLDLVGLKKGELDILDGSPPCSAFSTTVHHKIVEEYTDLFGNVHERILPSRISHGWNKTKNYSDDKKVDNIEDLFFEFIRIVDDIRPKAVIAENVKGLTVGDAKEKLNEIMNAFNDIGYNIVYNVLDTKNYGVPQTRKRTYFIGIRSDVCDRIGLNMLNMKNLYPTPHSGIVTLKEAMVGLDYDQTEVDMLIKAFTKSAYYKDTVSKMPIDPSKRLNGDNYHPKRHHFNVKRQSQYDVGSTITAMGSQMATGGGVHWLEPRKLTIGELKRIMSLPDDFILTGKWNQQAERVGRMVAPKMMYELANSIYEKVLKND